MQTQNRLVGRKEMIDTMRKKPNSTLENFGFTRAINGRDGGDRAGLSGEDEK